MAGREQVSPAICHVQNKEDLYGIYKSSCEEFVDVLASKAPVPGGGGASALVGAIGMALGNMVGSLTVGKKKYADVEADIIALKEKATASAGRFSSSG